MAKGIGVQDLPAIDYSSLPASVVDSAATAAKQLVGHSQARLQDLIDQMLATYEEARHSDVVVFFNSGGWGWNQADKTPGWESILDGINAELESLGYQPLVLNYRRTSGGLMGCIREFFEAARRYPNRVAGPGLARGVPHPEHPGPQGDRRRGKHRHRYLG